MKNYYVVQGKTTAIKVESPKYGILWILIDTIDLKIMPENSIIVDKSRNGFYAKYRDGKILQRIHRHIMGFPEGMEIDHWNHDTLDNRRKNLRVVTCSKNQHNQQNRKGYYWYKRYQKWKTQIMLNGKPIHLGYFEHEIDARDQYLLAKELIHV